MGTSRADNGNQLETDRRPPRPHHGPLLDQILWQSRWLPSIGGETPTQSATLEIGSLVLTHSLDLCVVRLRAGPSGRSGVGVGGRSISALPSTSRHTRTWKTRSTLCIRRPRMPEPSSTQESRCHSWTQLGLGGSDWSTRALLSGPLPSQPDFGEQLHGCCPGMRGLGGQVVRCAKNSRSAAAIVSGLP